MRGISSEGKVTVYVDPDELINAPLYFKGPDDEIPRRSGDWLGNAITRFVWYQMHAKTELVEGREFNVVMLEWNEERGQFEVSFMKESYLQIGLDKTARHFSVEKEKPLNTMGI